MFLSFLASWILTYFFLLKLDAPVSGFLIREIRAQDKWARHFTPEQGPRIIVTGGSTCTFSIDGGMATQEFHVPVINAGLGAGMGSAGIYLESSRLAKPGDTLVLCLETSLYGSPASFTQDVLQVLAFRRDLNLILHAREITGQSIPIDQLLFSPRPGLDAFAAFVGRCVTGTSFRYSNAQIRPGGLMVTDVRLRYPKNLPSTTISADNRILLVHFRDWAAKRGVSLICALPWAYTDPQDVDAQRLANARFASEMSQIIPVIHETELGVQSDPSLFADTEWHLTEAAAQVRTRELIKRVLARDYWRADTLAPFTKQH